MFLEYLIYRRIELSYFPLQASDIGWLGILYQLTYLHFSLDSHIKTECSKLHCQWSFSLAQGNMQI